VAHEQLPADLHVEIVDWIDQLPWMNPDLEDDLPEAVIRWRELVREADALIIGLPEYNYGPSPLAKNAIDWITRPPHDRVITGKVIAFMSSAGRSGGANAQQGLSAFLPFLGAVVVTEPPVQFASIAEHLDADGHSTDAAIEASVTEAVASKLAAVVHALEQRDAPT
jgi:chromate reductase